jgi:CheY-like chemotaxis protein
MSDGPSGSMSAGRVGSTRIVLVEGNFIRRQALQQLLLELGADVVAVDSAAEAIRTPRTTSGVVMIEVQLAMEQRALELLRRQRDMRTVLVSWQRAAPPPSARVEGAMGFIDLSGAESDVRSALQRVAHGQSPGWPRTGELPGARQRGCLLERNFRADRIALDLLIAPYLRKPMSRR